jgi:hypothetical protein
LAQNRLLVTQAEAGAERSAWMPKSALFYTSLG